MFVWQAAQDVIHAEEGLAFVREEIEAGETLIYYRPAAQALANAERVLAARRSDLARLVGDDQVDATVAARRADVAARIAAARR